MLERRVERGLPTPALDLQPDLFEDLVDVWVCFWRLAAARRCGYEGLPASLATVDIAAAIEIEDVDPQERKTWYRLLQAMDAAWMKNALDAQKKKVGKGRNRADAASRDRRPGRDRRGR
jgi:hypothetical protein